MARTELRAESIPQKLQQFHPLLTACFGPAHVALDVCCRVARAQLADRRRQLDQAPAHKPADLIEKWRIHRLLKDLASIEQGIAGSHYTELIGLRSGLGAKNHPLHK